ncbi:MAG: biotin/lipoyl-containing protein, partial [Pseudomonadota bacterium]
MPTEILMPALSPTMEEGTLAKWLVKEGDTVSSGDIMAEIETDKATMEFEAVDEGTIGKILVAEGSEGVKVNTAIAILLEDGESADDIETTAKAPEAASAADAGNSKAPVSGDEAAPAASEAPAPSQSETAAAPPAPKGAEGQRIFASPLARRIAKDKGLDLASIKGSGPHGRIVKADVEKASATPKPAASAPAATPAATPAVAASGPSASTVMAMYEGRDYEEVSLDGMRKTIASRLTEAKQSIPHFYLRRD